MTQQRRPCDLVLKGGVSSGIVYPPAIYEISRVFDLKRIGGTSAGAVAAALTAAAQYRRVRRAESEDAEAGYDRLSRLPDWLGAAGHLFALFAPNRATQRLFRALSGLVLSGKSFSQRLLAIPAEYSFAALLGALPGALTALAATQLEGRGGEVVHLLLALLIALAGAFAMSVAAFALDLFRNLPRNGFGLVSGIDDSHENPHALGPWLARELESIAGLPPAVVPLTFAMLWDPEAGPNVQGPDEAPDEPAVDLRLTTTSLSSGRPYSLPHRFERFYFKPDEMARYFPPHVVAWMEQKARPGAKQFAGFVPLPRMCDLPVVVATRMSLAFPLLLSAVPLHALDSDDTATPQPVWFTEGSVSGGLPLGAFDAPLPRWPTLALDLAGTTDARRNEPPPGADGRLLRYTLSNGGARPPGFGAVRSLPDFFAAMVEATERWQDVVLNELPGFRDRVVTIELTARERALRIGNDRKLLEELKQRGTRAGRALVERFGSPSTLERNAGMSWETHRFIRYRSALASLRKYLNDFHDGYGSPIAPDVPYADLIASGDTKNRPNQPFPFTDAEAGRRIAALTLAIDQLAQALEREAAIEEHAPRPVAELTVRPRLDE